MSETNYILSLESSSDTLGICLTGNNNILASVNYYKKNLHDKYLADITKRIFQDLSININELSAVAVAAGPGSFTGLRISAAFAKGLCFGTNIKFIAVPNLSAFAYNALDLAISLGKKYIYSTVVSHKNIIYFQKFITDGFINNEIEMTTIEDFSKSDFGDSIIVGNAANLVSSDNILFELYRHKSEIISKYSSKLYTENIFESVDDFEPIYIQDFIPKNSTKILNI
jgi:tRNA threonylcarbamoyladenosine biosynthesis protein TsaB